MSARSAATVADGASHRSSLGEKRGVIPWSASMPTLILAGPPFRRSWGGIPFPGSRVPEAMCRGGSVMLGLCLVGLCLCAAPPADSPTPDDLGAYEAAAAKAGLDADAHVRLALW